MSKCKWFLLLRINKTLGLLKVKQKNTNFLNFSSKYLNDIYYETERILES